MSSYAVVKEHNPSGIEALIGLLTLGEQRRREALVRGGEAQPLKAVNQ